jgi:hypothetical protein
MSGILKASLSLLIANVEGDKNTLIMGSVDCLTELTIAIFLISIDPDPLVSSGMLNSNATGALVELLMQSPTA